MPEVICIGGQRKLSGTVRVSGAKNAALPLLFATILTDQPCEISNVPDLHDIGVTVRLLNSLGGKAEYNGNAVRVCMPKLAATTAPYHLVKALRASFWVLGPLLARCGEARVSLPGGDAIGTRPVDLHLKGLGQMGAEFRIQNGVVIADAPGGLRGAHIDLEFPSVGATHNLLMAAAGTPGETIISGAAREPEIAELAAFLQSMGAEIEGAGSEKIRVIGRKDLAGGKHQVLGDRVEAATYLLSGAVTGGRVGVTGIEASAMQSTLDVLDQIGCAVVCASAGSTKSGADGGSPGIVVQGPARLRAVDVATAPFPGLATDVQPLVMAALTMAEGVSSVREDIFENRFGHVAEYRRLGADISVEGRVATIRGVSSLSAAPVEAGDIRAAAGLVLMGLMAEGVTQIREIHHLDRGYDGLIEKFRSLGADISRVASFGEKEIIVGC